MKIAITSQGPGLDSPLDPRFGRAKGFIVYDLEGGGFEHVDNAQNLEAAQGAGIQAAGIVAATGALALVSGHVGPKAYAALRAAGISMHIAEGGSVSEAIEAFKAGKLPGSAAPDVEGHW
jgi:predicted Fe-Mo cluster-binding NifX family protein